MDILKKILQVLENKGPLKGKELYDIMNIDELTLWKTCYESDAIFTKIFGKRYLRLDKRVKGYARLSPSIMREFLTYTVIGLQSDIKKINSKVDVFYNEIKEISREKYKLAYNTIVKLVESSVNSENLKKNSCFIIAGDVVYDMAHSELRPESSSGEMVNGSDLDIVIVTQGLSDKIVKALDSSIYKEKSYLLKNPRYKEEIDYIIKDISKTYEQMEFKDFKSMIASKILHEGVFLYGNQDIFDAIKNMLIKKNVLDKLSELEKKAIENREEAFQYLLSYKNELFKEEFMIYFYTKNESEEIF